MNPVTDTLARQHEIIFFALPEQQAIEAAHYLATLPGITVRVFPGENRIAVHYALPAHTLEEIEQRLSQAGFHLDESIMSKIKRALAHYCEDIAISNLEIPEHNIKNKDIYAKVWSNHPHGDHDDTPEELRRYL